MYTVNNNSSNNNKCTRRVYKTCIMQLSTILQNGDKSRANINRKLLLTSITKSCFYSRFTMITATVDKIDTQSKHTGE